MLREQAKFITQAHKVLDICLTMSAFIAAKFHENRTPCESAKSQEQRASSSPLTTKLEAYPHRTALRFVAGTRADVETLCGDESGVSPDGD